MNVEVRDASWAVDARRIVDTVNLNARPGELIGLIGPNGSGKSSLLRLIYRMYTPCGGTILLNDRDIWTLSAKMVAQSEAVVAQENASDFDFTVEEIVLMGRTPHKKLFDLDTLEDDEIVNEALSRVGMVSFSQRNLNTLSGGEKQRVLVARALAQQAQLLVLDEPTNHLDICSQLETMELVRSLGVTTILALHDLNLAATYCDRLYLLKSGQVVACGRPHEVLTPMLIESVYDVHAEVNTHPLNGQLYILFTSKSGSRRSF